MLIKIVIFIPIVFILTIIFKLNLNLNNLNSIIKRLKVLSLISSILTLFITLIMFIFFNFSSLEYQFVIETYNFNGININLGIDGISMYFILLTVLIMPISILSNWNSISENTVYFLIILLLLEIFLTTVFLVLDIFLFYIFFESILIPLFLLIGTYGSYNKVRASFYLFLYTLFGSLFLLISILYIYVNIGTTNFDFVFKSNFEYKIQLLLFTGIFISLAVKTPVIFLHNWLLKAHVESPLGGSIILAGIVLKLSLYGILRLILPILPKASLNYTYIVYVIGVITVIYASVATLRTIDIKELIAYSSVSHAAIYLMGSFSNTIQGLEGSIILGIAHGFVSSGLFICVGGVLYDRVSTRLIYIYRGMAQIMPVFSILFFILCLSNAGTPLSLNFIGEFLSLYGIFERIPILGLIASFSIVLSAAYTMFMFNRIVFGGKLSKYFIFNILDLSRREYYMLFILVLLTVILGIYPVIISDILNYSLSSLIYNTNI